MQKMTADWIWPIDCNLQTPALGEKTMAGLITFVYML